MSRHAFQTLLKSGSTLQRIPGGRPPWFKGKELHISTGAFNVFNTLRTKGEITFEPRG